MDNKLQTYYNLWSCILNDDKPKFIELENLDNEITHLENLILSTAYFPVNYKLILAGVSYNNYYEKLKFLIKKNMT